ncbi:outer membrane usher protein [Providencia alcalifaciens]|uniref:outer membrane usher protein n=1 Tax=Providencia alcalifaciens TaxID=126385 RepID=UPI001CC6209D|nr:outer membrane usher protein [Providencia alcalifaciens]CAG9406714.1 Outer membrane usher protein PapC [Providencia alcalifaciens]
MSSLPIHTLQLKFLSIILGLIVGFISLTATATNYMEFNTDILDLEDKNNIDLNQFSRAGYIMPGVYNFTLKVNNEQISDVEIPYYISEHDPENSLPCLSPELVNQLELTPESLKKLTWWHEGLCLNEKSLPGLLLRGDLATSSLYVSIPQAYMEYTSPNWDPPSRWDDGISALLFDYNVNANTTRSYIGGTDSSSVNSNGVTGINLGAWRFRADWQSRYIYTTGRQGSNQTDFTWNRFYAYRALSALKAKLVLGEDYLASNIFDGFRFLGASLQSELSMMPPNLRGYAPEITGIAKSNATVIVMQQGRVLHETQVASGPFRIQNLSDAITGTLDVIVKEQDGSVQEFQVDTANLPYLTRPGQVQYKLALGQPTNINRQSEGENFITGEFSWGISNGWSLIGGSLNSQNYNALSIGFGRDLLAFGALSFDVTQSIVRLSGEDTLSGGSYRINYSKRFEQFDSQIQFAGYRFSERSYMSMSDFLNTQKTGERYYGSKELYTISMNKNFNDIGLSLYLNYNHQTYWDRPDNDYYSLMLSKYMDIGSIKNVSISVSANRSFYNEVKDDSAYVSLSFPLSNGANIGYSMNTSRDDTTNRISYYDRLGDRTNYQISAGANRKGGTASAFITHQGDNARWSANASHTNNQYSAVGLSAAGGFTLTTEGAVAHRMNNLGGTRLLVDTDSVPDIAIRGVGPPVKSNRFGKAVISDVSSYYRNKAQIDLNKLPEDVDAQQSVVQATLTEGAVGYRSFFVISGQKIMTVIALSDGSHPPLGAQVTNHKKQNVGIVGDLGNTYISGVHSSEVMNVSWGKNRSCEIIFPSELMNQEIQDSLLLPCQ